MSSLTASCPTSTSVCDDVSHSVLMAASWRESWPRALKTLLVICISLSLAKWLVRSAGRVAGWYLKRHASTRKKAILRRVKIEEEAFQSFSRRSRRQEEDDDWEKIESYGAGSAINGGQADDGWEGIIGFFHPFWLVQLNLHVHQY